ncbi:MAG: hypothetical protein U9N42_03800 [Campylobacterota bacterium]|nr:hypothetical protein [Campylobacterota bacterium]
MNENRLKLIEDIEKLLNSYGGHDTQINPDLLEYMDESSLKDIIGSLLRQKENPIDQDWLQQFKKED